MATRKQIAANRRNASKSSGPRTRKGKSVSRINAMRHGLSAKAVLVDGEDPEEFSRFVSALKSDFGCDSILVRTEVEQLACLYWQRQRIRRVQAGILSAQQRNLRAQPLKDLLAELETSRSNLLEKENDIPWDLDKETKTSIEDLDELREVVTRDLYELWREEKSDAEELAAIFVGDIANLEKLQRFETANERAIQRCYDRILAMMSQLTESAGAEVIDLEVVSGKAVTKRVRI